MRSRKMERLLEMVEGLHSKLDRYVADSTLPAEAVPDIFDFCRRMRALNPDTAPSSTGSRRSNAMRPKSASPRRRPKKSAACPDPPDC
jgi:hypothetical protein